MSSKGIFIDGIALAGYRSFGKDLQHIGPFAKLNLFIGANNSGKSNILRFLRYHYAFVIASCRGVQEDPRFSPLDRHHGQDPDGFTFGITWDVKDSSQLAERFPKLKDADTDFLFNLFSSCLVQPSGNGGLWFIYHADSLGGKLQLSKDQLAIATEIAKKAHGAWRNTWSRLTEQQGGDISRHWVPETIHAISPVHKPSPKVDLVPAIRQIGEPEGPTKQTDGSEFLLHIRDTVTERRHQYRLGLGELPKQKDQKKHEPVDDELGGHNIIDRLAELQNPSRDNYQAFRLRFDKINDFLCTVTGNEDSRIEIPYQRDTILVHMDGKVLPLQSLGTGIHEVIILAAAATILNNQVLCLEEPELHLHPSLQRKLVRYLLDNTDNQYFITTHSAHLLDTPEAAIFRIWLEDNATHVSPAISANEKFQICHELGYRASDILQTNCIIWVEGPSDRIYIKYWIEAKDSTLKEGIHYSIMFYGGRLLSHLSADDKEVDDFIGLRNLNRNLIVVMDSDKKYKEDSINATKLRVVNDFNAGPGFTWITAGRTIENYISHELMVKCAEEVSRGSGSRVGLGAFDHAVPTRSDDNSSQRIDKVALARKVAANSASYDVLDLNIKIEKVIDLIRKANQ